MSRYIVFSDVFLSQVRGGVALHQVVSLEVKLRRSGKDYLGCCPFHDERTPSFRVFTDRNTYRCFGCGASGDVIEWARRRHDLSFHDAVLRAANMAGIPTPIDGLDAQSPAKRRRISRVREALTQAQRLYRQGLRTSDIAMTYLQAERGLTPETIERFGLGVVAKGVIDFMRKHNMPEVLSESGLACETEGGVLYDRFRHRVIFPIVSESGNLVGFAGRSLREHPDTPKYLNSPETELFHKGRELYGLHLAKATIRRARSAVVVEGYFDVLSLHQSGDERAVAPMGTALTGSQVRRLLTHAESVVLAFDGDDAGRRAAVNAATVFLREMKDGATASVLVLPEGQDPDSYVRKQGVAGWRSAVAGAKPLSEFLCDIVREGLDRTLPESQVRAAAKATHFLSQIDHAPMFLRAMKTKFEEVIGFSIGPLASTTERRSSNVPGP